MQHRFRQRDRRHRRTHRPVLAVSRAVDDQGVTARFRRWPEQGHGGRLNDGVELLSKPYSQEEPARKLRKVLAAPAAAALQSGSQSFAPFTEC